MSERNRIFRSCYHHKRNWWPHDIFNIVVCYGLDGPGIGSQWRPDFPWHPDWSWVSRPSLLYSGSWVFPRGKRLDRGADYLHPSARLQMGRSYTFAYHPLCLHGHMMGWLVPLQKKLKNELWAWTVTYFIQHCGAKLQVMHWKSELENNWQRY